MENNIKIVTLRFIDAINEHDVHSIMKMLSPDHIFIDSLGEKISGEENLKKNWINYFELFPDFHMAPKNLMAQGEMSFIIGRATATLPNEASDVEDSIWEIPVAWKAIIENDLVKEWQVCTDNKTIFEVLENMKLSKDPSIDH